MQSYSDLIKGDSCGILLSLTFFWDSQDFDIQDFYKANGCSNQNREGLRLIQMTLHFVHKVINDAKFDFSTVFNKSKP